MRLLSGDAGAQAPYPWLVSVVCEAFSCTPSQAEAEIERDNEREEPLLFDILDLRAFAECKREFDAAARAGREVETTPMMRQLMMLEYRLMRERRGLPAE